jgi:hypothetical protein
VPRTLATPPTAYPLLAAPWLALALAAALTTEALTDATREVVMPEGEALADIVDEAEVDATELLFETDEAEADDNDAEAEAEADDDLDPEAELGDGVILASRVAWPALPPPTELKDRHCDVGPAG